MTPPSENNQPPQTPAIIHPQSQEGQAILSKIPPQKRQALQAGPAQAQVQQVQIETRAMLHSGPVPPPEMLDAYNKVLPGAAERILAMTEEQHRHRLAMEAHVIPNREKRTARGQHYALTIGIIAIVGAVACAYLGQQVIGTVLVGTPLGSLAYAFLTGKQKQEKDLAQKKG